MTDLSLFFLPVGVLFTWIASEGLVLIILKRDASRRPVALTLLLWTVRPWAVWATVNLVFRWNAELGFNNPLTFPFYANPWSSAETYRLISSPTVWRWTSVALSCFIVLLYVASRVLRRDSHTRSFTALALVAVYFAGVGLHLSIACIPFGAVPVPGKSPGYASLTVNWPNNTILPAVRVIEDTDSYLRDLHNLRPQLSSIHALSHPPGAPLSLYWIGLLVGADTETDEYSRLIRYVIGLTSAGLLNVFVVYVLGSRLFQSAKVGFVSSLLWVVMPAALAFSTYAQDVLYAVCFNAALCLSWMAVTRGDRVAPCANNL